MARLRKALDVDQARELYESGLSLRAVAAAFGWSYGGIHHRFEREGIRFRSRGGRPRSESR